VYVNGKMRPVEATPGMGEGRIKENDGGGEFKCDVSNIRTFANATMYPHPAQQ
jgi:hypothetical protein